MKKFIILMAAFMMTTSISVYAQEDQKDEAAAKAAKAEAKAKKKAEKADKQKAKNAKILAEYEEFIATYTPLEKTGDAKADAFVATVNTTTAALNGIYEEVGYIEIETEETENELGEKDITIKRIYDKKTGKDVEKTSAFTVLGKALPEILALKPVVEGLPAQLKSVANPASLLSLGLKGKNLVKHAKMIIKVFPLIVEQIKKNKEILATK